MLVRCAEVVLEKGHQVFGVISSNQAIRDWSDRRNLPYIQPTDNLVSFLSQQPFDYLFSIVNNIILPEEILKLPRQYAINFHDALLPRYAGVNATAWAIAHRETKHGITWHIMSDLVDGGDILKQAIVDVAPDETAFMLNGKCYEAAIASFRELIDELSANRASATKQQPDERTYFPRSKRPGAGGLLSFDRPAGELDALVRALDFGSYPNPLSLPKLPLGNHFVIVSQLEVLDKPSALPPGAITAIEPDCLKIATTSYDVALRQVRTVDDRALTIPDLVAEYELQVGDRIEKCEPSLAEQIETFDAAIAKHETFWVERLASLQPIAIPQAVRKASHWQQKQYEQLKAIVPQEVILFLQKRYPNWKLQDFLLAAFVSYLARISGMRRFDIGYTDVALKRQISAIERLFAICVPCRIAIDCEQSFEAIFAALQAQLESTKRHKTYARDIVLRYPVLRSRSQLSKEGILAATVELVETLDDCQTRLSSELTLAIPEHSKQYCWFYNSQALDGESVGRLQSQFITFLQGIVRAPTRSLAYLPLVSEEERQQIFGNWNDTRADYPQDKCIHQLFEERVKQIPDRVAVVCAGRQITYRDINERANRLAHYLQKLGVKPEILVGICVERSIEAIVGLLGILKAGGAYLPLDPAYPQERLAYMLSDARATVLLTQKKLATGLSKRVAKVVYLDTELADSGREIDRNLASRLKPENLAYVIYTSGSTGKPKGVAIAHGSVLNTIVDINRRFNVGGADRVLSLSSLSFDLSVYDIFGLLAAGGKIVFPDPSNPLDPAGWLDLIVRERITVWNSAPALMEIFVGYLTQHAEKLPQSLRLVLLSGDRIPVNLAVRLKAMNDKLQLISLGGATEASIWSIFYAIEKLDPAWKSIPYGRPLSNQTFYVLDADRQPLPVGIPGELYIGGVGLARGYLNRPELTQEKFIANPFCDRAKDRLYKTGDLGRYLSDGNIEFLGRIDCQVKIRGFRIELGEIETVLAQHPAVREIAVVAREDISEDKCLIAYLVPSQEKTPTIDELRCFLKQKLPDYMVPSAFVILDSLPLTANGKLDRRALPAPEPTRARSEQLFIPPRDDLELQLQKIWEKVLGMKSIGIRDNFFDLGGHSLLAVRLFDHIEKQLGKNLPLVTLFQAPTIEELASILRQQAWSALWSSLVAIQPGGSKPPFFCIHEIGGSILYYQGLAHHLGSEHPFYGLQAVGLDGKREPHTRIEDMAAHYIKEIQSVQPEGPYFLGGHSFGGLVAFEMAQQLQKQGQKVALLALFDCLRANDTKKLTFSDWLSIHLKNLAQLELKEKLAYIWMRVQLHVNKITPKPIIEIYFDLRDRLRAPQELRYRRILKTNLKAEENYVPKVYPGKVTLFRAKVRPPQKYFDPYGGWGNLVLGGVEMIEVPGEHLSLLFKESNVKILAERLRASLDKAQNNNG